MSLSRQSVPEEECSIFLSPVYRENPSLREEMLCGIECVCVCDHLSPYCFLNTERKSVLMSVLREHQHRRGIHATAEFVHKCLSALSITQRPIGGQQSVPRFDLVKNEMGNIMNEI